MRIIPTSIIQVTSSQAKNTQSIKEAASAVGSISTDELDIRFNPDIFSPTVNVIADDAEIQRQKQLVVDVAAFLVNEQIPAFIRECKEGQDSCLDCVSMVENLHSKVNMRFIRCQSIKLRVSAFGTLESFKKPFLRKKMQTSSMSSTLSTRR